MSKKCVGRRCLGFVYSSIVTTLQLNFTRLQDPHPLSFLKYFLKFRLTTDTVVDSLDLLSPTLNLSLTYQAVNTCIACHIAFE